MAREVTLSDFAVFALIRIPSDYGGGRAGVILVNHDYGRSVNFEVHSKWRSRLYWNHAEVDLFGRINVADGKRHCIVFVRDTFI